MIGGAVADRSQNAHKGFLLVNNILTGAKASPRIGTQRLKLLLNIN
jgi:hypothetical protein